MRRRPPGFLRKRRRELRMERRAEWPHAGQSHRAVPRPVAHANDVRLRKFPSRPRRRIRREKCRVLRWIGRTLNVRSQDLVSDALLLAEGLSKTFRRPWMKRMGRGD